MKTTLHIKWLLFSSTLKLCFVSGLISWFCEWSFLVNETVFITGSSPNSCWIPVLASTRFILLLVSFNTYLFIAGIRVLDGPLTDSMEAIAFNKHYQINDIYSCRWLKLYIYYSHLPNWCWNSYWLLFRLWCSLICRLYWWSFRWSIVYINSVKLTICCPQTLYKWPVRQGFFFFQQALCILVKGFSCTEVQRWH